MKLGALAVVLLVGCGDLHPFAEGPGSASGGASASGGETETGGIGPNDGALVYVRCPRTTTPIELTADVVIDGATVSRSRTFHHADTYDRLPTSHGAAGSVAPCDLILQPRSGEAEVLFDCTALSTATEGCVAIDPAISHDGTQVAFAVVYGAIGRTTNNVAAQALDPAAEAGNVGSVELPSPMLSPARAEIHVIDLVTGETHVAAGDPDELRMSPSFLDDGRVAFVSNRAGHTSTAVRFVGDTWGTWATPPALQLHTMAPDGSDVELVSHHAMAADGAPFQLRDGRVALVATQRVGLLPYRYDNGSLGSSGAWPNVHHLYAQDPDGARLTALFGQHTHLLGGAFEHSDVAQLDQLADGRVIFIEGTGPYSGGIGGGSLRAFAPDPNGREGPAPHTVPAGDVFRPTDLETLTPWVGGGITGFSAVTAEPAVTVEGYADPLAFAGLVRDAIGEPGGGALLGWAKGACCVVASHPEDLFGNPAPPATSGDGGLAAANALEWLGRDNPGCDVGIWRADTLPVAHPGALTVVVDDVRYHEIMPAVVRGYAEVHGQDRPDAIAPAHRRAAVTPILPLATPFALLGGSSLVQRETRSLDDGPFASEIAWALQGGDAADYDDDEICGLRIVALMPDVADDASELFGALGHRALVVAELPVRKTDAGTTVLDPLGDPDTSFRVRVPADTPLLVAGIDCEGRNLSASQVPFSLRPGEDRRCGGCHVRSQLPLRFEETRAADPDFAAVLAGAGEVPLLAGGEVEAPALLTDSGFGRAFEFGRDVWPILQARCVSCHTGDAAPAGLVLDQPGVDPGSTWWRLVADAQQSYVPAELQLPGAGTLSKPQLTRHIRFLSARGSLLYWKAANMRTDGRTDADFDAGDGVYADIDFGLDHPTEITDAELRTLARWIDTGASGGAASLADTAPPVLVARIAADAPDVLVIGTLDIGAGIDPASLTVEHRAAAASWSALAAPSAAMAGTVTVGLAGVDAEATLRMRVADAAGNVTTIERRRAALREP